MLHFHFQTFTNDYETLIIGLQRFVNLSSELNIH